MNFDTDFGYVPYDYQHPPTNIIEEFYTDDYILEPETITSIISDSKSPFPQPTMLATGALPPPLPNSLPPPLP